MNDVIATLRAQLARLSERLSALCEDLRESDRQKMQALLDQAAALQRIAELEQLLHAPRTPGAPAHPPWVPTAIDRIRNESALPRPTCILDSGRPVSGIGCDCGECHRSSNPKPGAVCRCRMCVPTAEIDALVVEGPQG